MFAEQLQRAVEAAPRVRLVELSAALWKGHAAGAIGDDDAQRLAELIEARKTIPVSVHQCIPSSRRQGSRPRSSESMERRRRWVASGWLPPTLACRFTAGELAALSAMASQVAKHGRCTLALDHLAALAGVSRTTVRNGIAEARKLGLLSVEERRLRAFRSDTNVVRVVSAEWQAWLSMRRSSPGQRVGTKPCAPRNTQDSFREEKRCDSTRPMTGDSRSPRWGTRW